MKKSIGIYTSIWAICLALFNTVVFVTPSEIDGVSRLDTSFWIGYAFITLTFVIQLVCACFALKQSSPRKLVYGIPLISVSYVGLVAMLIAGGIFMAVPALPEWIGIIVCTVILALNLIAVIKAGAVGGIVSELDGRVLRETEFIREMTGKAQSLMSAAATDVTRAQARRVYEAIRYSDPVSSEALSDINAQLGRQIAAFADAVAAEDGELAAEIASTVVELAEKRSVECRRLKN